MRMTKPSPPTLWAGQALHLAALAVLIAATAAVWTGLGEPHPGAFWTAVLIPVAHQVFVWLTWRLELRSQD